MPTLVQYLPCLQHAVDVLLKCTTARSSSQLNLVKAPTLPSCFPNDQHSLSHKCSLYAILHVVVWSHGLIVSILVVSTNCMEYILGISPNIPLVIIGKLQVSISINNTKMLLKGTNTDLANSRRSFPKKTEWS